MQEQKNKSAKNYHIDKSVLLFFAITFFVFTAVFAYRYTKYEPCAPIKFQVIAKEKRVGQLLKFVDYTLGAENWEWHFGDSSEVKREKTPYHVFKSPGKYAVRLIINGKCETYQTILVERPLEILDSTKLPIFNVPDKVMVGQKMTVIDNTAHAKEWEWRFGETANIDSYKRKSEYIYTEPGLKTISLVINGDLKHVGKKKITVLPKPKTKRPVRKIKRKSTLAADLKYKPVIGLKEIDDTPDIEETVEVPYISEKAFADILIEISKNKALANDFQPYMCGELNLPIVVNKRKMEFLVFCQKIRNKNITIKELSIIRTPDNNCIKNIIVKYKRSIF